MTMTIVALTARRRLAQGRRSNRLERATTDRREMDGLGERFSAGDPDALRQVYRRYGGPVFAVAHRILGDREQAEDAVQRTFLNAWRAADRFDGARDLGPWLFTIARRAAIDVYRREKRHRADELADHDVSILPESFEATWAAWEVRKAIEQLPSEEREVLHATHFQGLTHGEAADKLGLPVGTVKSRSHRAYRRLADLLRHLEEAPA
jgi:RNA polymerase sigma-70 factor (ECF subfamily)